MAANEVVILEGGEQLAALYKRVRATGDNELRKNLLRAIRIAVKPIPDAIRKEARATLPRRGGLADYVAKSTIAIRTQTTASRQRDPGVRILGTLERQASKAARKGKKGADRPPPQYIDVLAIEQGLVRHPVFGNRQVWTTTILKPGFWSRPADAHADDVEKNIIRALNETAEYVARIEEATNL